jgi:hypothetical protein
MKYLTKILLVPVVLFSLINSAYAQSRRPQARSIISTSVVVLRYKHTDSSSMQDHTDTLKIPVVNDNYPELKKALSFESIGDPDGLDSVITNYAGCSCGITGMDYKVTFENTDILSIKIYQETMAAYPDSYTQWLTLNIHTGLAYPVTNEISSTGLKWIYNNYKALMKKRIAADMGQVKIDKDFDKDAYNGVYKDLTESIDTLTLNDMINSYVFTNTGIIFTTEDILPHVVHALEPDRDWFIPYKKLKPYILPHALVLK